MNATIEALIKGVDKIKRTISGINGTQIQSESNREKIRVLCQEYFALRADLIISDNVIEADKNFQKLHALARSKPSKAKVLDHLKIAKRVLVDLEGASLISTTPNSTSDQHRTDRLIIESLNDVCAPAASSYAQALQDLRSEERISWRGPATDLREAMRETLDVLAPDVEVSVQSGFKLEKEAHRPTMKQKVRFILKKRGTPHGAMAAPEHAVQGVEDIVGGITRSVYDRTSISTHTATDKKEVLRLHAWVRLVLCELLEVPHE